jgi:hypothetical protein
MRRVGEQIAVSASDLSNFLACRHLTRLDAAALDGLVDAPHLRDVGFEALVERGEAHEKTVLDGVLVGHYGQPWPTSTMEAHCAVGHPAPDWDCNCGIYATKQQFGSFGHVFGQVAMEGIVIEHEDGYRAERARIVELRVSDAPTEEWVRQRYQDVTVRLDLPTRNRI